MSVRIENRGTSKTEFLRVASEIQADTVYLATRLSNRMKRPIGDPITTIANNISHNLYAGNKIRIVDQLSFDLRRQKFLSAMSDLDAFVVDLNLLYTVLKKNPQGAYRTETGKTILPAEALEKIDKRVSELKGRKDKLEKLINGVIKSDNKIFPQYYNTNVKEKQDDDK